jgi:hypothetical protein
MGGYLNSTGPGALLLQPYKCTPRADSRPWGGAETTNLRRRGAMQRQGFRRHVMLLGEVIEAPGRGQVCQEESRSGLVGASCQQSGPYRISLAACVVRLAT